MERPSKTPRLSVIVPSTSSTPPRKASVAAVGLSESVPLTASLTPGRSKRIIPAKQKRLFPIACRLVPTDQWFTTRIDRTWNVLDLKIWLLSKALPTPELPLPASYRPSSPVTFAAAPPPTSRQPSVTSYQTLTPLTSSTSMTLNASQASVSPVSPIIFADAPNIPNRPPTSVHYSPQTPVQHLFYPPLSSAADTLPSPGPYVPTPGSSRLSFGQDDENLPLNANPYGPVPNDHFHEDSDEEVIAIAPRSIPYSFNTGTPAISGLAALKSTPNMTVPGRGYSGSLSNVDMELVRKATTIAKRWLVYSFSTGMLLSDDRPLTEYSIRAHELLELHRAGAYVSLPRASMPSLGPSSASHNRGASAAPPISTKSARAYPSGIARQSSPRHTQMDKREPASSDSSDDEDDHMAAGSPYAQPYFDGWALVLREGVSRANGNIESRTDAGDADGHGRKMRRRGRAKSEAAKSGRGKDRTRLEREWKDLKHPLRKEIDTGIELEEHSDRWRQRWLIIREGHLTVWKDRKDDFPEERYNIASCAGLYGPDRLPSIISATSDNVASSETSHSTASHAPSASMITSSASSFTDHIICARFRQPSHHSGMEQIASMDSRMSRKYNKQNGAWLVLKVADAATHEHLLRIFHRLSYSSPISYSSHPSTSTSSVAQSRTLPTRTLRTNFVPNPIPHPLSLSFSPPSPVQQDDASPVSPFDDLAPRGGSNDDEWPGAGSTWGRSRRRTLGKVVPKYFGLGRGVVGVRYPEWREDVIQKAICAGRGLTLPESQRRSDSSPDAETPPGDQLDMYGFVREDLYNYAANDVHEDYRSDDSDSDAYSEAEWESWAYDLDRPKVVDEIGTTLRTVRDGLNTPQGSPVSEPELATVARTPVDTAISLALGTRRLRPRSINPNSPAQANFSSPSLSPTAPSPTTPRTRLRASTISSHTSHATANIAESDSVTGPFFVTSTADQVDQALRSDVPTPLRAGEPTATSGVRSLMRGLSMRAGKESFMRGLENALDFVEGK